MSERLPNAEHSARPANEAAARRKGWRRLAWLLLLVQSTLFWQGCEGQQVHLSLGLGGPWVAFGYDDSLASSQLLDFSPLLLVVNALLIAAVVLLVGRLSQRWFERCTSRHLVAAAAIATLIFNSILYFAGAWIHLVALPVSWLIGLAFGNPGNHESLIYGSLTRAYYLLGVALVAGVLRLVQWLLRRYIFIHADRWQVSLGGLLVLMALLGTGIGLLLRLLAN